MVSKQLPTRLGKEPLIDVVFEIRFEVGTSAAEILPGFLHAKLGGGVKIERLPVSQLPLEIRRTDVNLANQPLVRITWKNYLLMVGDNSLAVGCLLPYPGWTEFRETILKIVAFLAEASIVQSVQRYSLKYVDILPVQQGENVGDWINVKVTVGESELKSQPFQLHMEEATGKYRHLLQLAAPAQAHGIDGVIRAGMVVSVDTVVVDTMPPFSELIAELPARIDDIHSSNKQMFFDCLTVGAVQKLEPVYE